MVDTNEKIVYAAAGVTGVVAALGAAYYIYSRKNNDSEEDTVTPAENVSFYADGIEFRNVFEMPADEKNLLKLVKRNEDEQFPLTLIKKEAVSHDTYRLTFAFPEKDLKLGCFGGAHLGICGLDKDGKQISRKYSQISHLDQAGEVTFVTKVYRPNEEFPEGGALSGVLDKVEVGQQVMFESPVGGYAKIRYTGNGEFKRMKVDEPCKYTKLGFIAGGSGITPCFAIMQASIKAGEKCISEMGLLFSNKTEQDILLKDEIEQLKKMRTDMKVAHTLTRQENVPEGMFKGRVTREMIEKTMPAPSDETLIWICGPGALRKHLEPILFEMGYTEAMLN